MAITPEFYAAVAKYAAKYHDEVVVIKFGGELAAQEDVLRNLMVQAINLKNFGARVVIVHGGGVQIDDAMLAAGIEPKKKVAGVRPTDMQDLEIAHKALNELNRQIVNVLQVEAGKLGANVSAIGLGANDGKLITAKPYEEIRAERTGQVSAVNKQMLFDMSNDNRIPVIHSICLGTDGICMNVNADDVAASIALHMQAMRLIMCSNTKGVLDKDGALIPSLYTDEIAGLIADGTIAGGMINKVKVLAEFADLPGVGGVVILDGSDKQAIEDELLTDQGVGTLIQSRASTMSKDVSLVPVNEV